MRTLSMILGFCAIVGCGAYVAGVIAGTEHAIHGCDSGARFRIGQHVYKCEPASFTR